MKIFLAILTCFLAVSTSADAQSRFEPDSVSFEYAQCKGDSAAQEIRLINRGSSLEVLDVRFADSNRTWEIFDTLGGHAFIKGALLFGGDTLTFRVRQKVQLNPTNEWYMDTLVTSGAATSDTVLLNARILAADLRTDLEDVDLGVINQGNTVTHSFTIWNDGEVSHIFNYILTSGWELVGLGAGDTLHAGDSMEVTVRRISTSSIGTLAANLTIGGDCDALPTAMITAKVVPSHAQWVQPILIDTVRGCDEAHEFAVAIANRSTSVTRIDSIEFIGQGSPFWSIDAASFPISIVPGESRSLTLVRQPNAQATTTLVIHSDKPGDDTLTVSVTSRITRPRIEDYKDTVVLALKPSQAIAYDIEIVNQGPGSYRLTTFDLDASEKWSVLGFDTITTASQSKSLKVTLVFAGSDLEGDFPARIQLQGVECDTLLSQVLVARVTEPARVEYWEELDVKVHPSVATTTLTLEVPPPYAYNILDVLGNSVLTGSSRAGSTTIDISSLTAGRYFVRVITAKRLRMLPITIAR